MITSFFLSLPRPKTKYPSFETLTFLLSILTVELGVVMPKINDPCSNFPIKSNTYVSVQKNINIIKNLKSNFIFETLEN